MEPPAPITTNMELLLSSSQQHNQNDDISTTANNRQTDPQIQYDPSKGIRTPAPSDVICGRGKMTVAHPGNRRFRVLVRERKNDYQKATRRDDKTRITQELVQSLRNGPEGGRFLLYDPHTNLWYDVGDEYAREKVSHSLRSRPSEHRRSNPKPRKKIVRKTPYSPALDAVVRRLIHDQQALLKSMIDKETSRAAAEAVGANGLDGMYS